MNVVDSGDAPSPPLSRKRKSASSPDPGADHSVTSQTKILSPSGDSESAGESTNNSDSNSKGDTNGSSPPNRPLSDSELHDSGHVADESPASNPDEQSLAQDIHNTSDTMDSTSSDVANNNDGKDRVDDINSQTEAESSDLTTNANKDANPENVDNSGADNETSKDYAPDPHKVIEIAPIDYPPMPRLQSKPRLPVAREPVRKNPNLFPKLKNSYILQQAMALYGLSDDPKDAALDNSLDDSLDTTLESTLNSTLDGDNDDSMSNDYPTLYDMLQNSNEAEVVPAASDVEVLYRQSDWPAHMNGMPGIPPVIPTGMPMGPFGMMPPQLPPNGLHPIPPIPPHWDVEGQFKPKQKYRGVKRRPPGIPAYIPEKQIMHHVSKSYIKLHDIFSSVQHRGIPSEVHVPRKPEQAEGEDQFFMCPWCSFRSDRPTFFYSHLVSDHHVESISSGALHSCPGCDLLFTNLLDSHKHIFMSRHLSIDDAIMFRCTAQINREGASCNRGFTHKNLLIKHEAEIHGVFQPGILYCPQCPALFTDQEASLYDQHKNAHDTLFR